MIKLKDIIIPKNKLRLRNKLKKTKELNISINKKITKEISQTNRIKKLERKIRKQKEKFKSLNIKLKKVGNIYSK